MLDSTAPAGVGHGYRLRVREPDVVERIIVPEMTPYVIGREEDCDLEVRDLQVSRHHAQLEIRPDGRVIVRDLDSANGTFLDAVRVSGGAWLPLPGTVTLGRTTIVVELVTAAAPHVAAGEVWAAPAAQAVAPSKPAATPIRIEKAARDAVRWLRFGGAFMVGTGIFALVVTFLLSDRLEAGLALLLGASGTLNVVVGVAELVLAQRLRHPDRRAWQISLIVVTVVILLAGINLVSVISVGATSAFWGPGLALALAAGAAGSLYRSRSWHLAH